MHQLANSMNIYMFEGNEKITKINTSIRVYERISVNQHIKISVFQFHFILRKRLHSMKVYYTYRSYTY